MILFWSRSAKYLTFFGLWLIEQFSRISRWNVQRIDLKLSGCIHLGNLHPCTIKFWPRTTEFFRSAGLLLVQRLPHISRQIAHCNGCKLDRCIQYGLCQDWLTCLALLNPSSELPPHPLWFNPQRGMCMRWSFLICRGHSNDHRAMDPLARVLYDILIPRVDRWDVKDRHIWLPFHGMYLQDGR